VRDDALLIVDDDQDILGTLHLLLEAAGYNARTAANGVEALESIEREGMPRLVLLDMKMPVMDGWQFIAEFDRRYGRAVPVVVMTAATSAKDRAQAATADAYLAKPFSFDVLVELLRKYLDAGAGSPL
jgi:CheY-like chemotaxis protein